MLRGDRPRGLEDLLVARAAAQIARNRLDELGVGRRWVRAEEVGQRDEHARRAVAALQSVKLAEGFLQRTEPARRLEALDSGDLCAVDLGGQDEARANHFAVEQHVAAAAHALLAAGVGTVEM